MSATVANTSLHFEAETKQIRNYELPRPRRQYQLGITLLKKHRNEEAMERFREAIALDKAIAVDVLIQLYKRLIVSYDQVEYRLMVAQIYCDIGQFKEAIYELEEVFDLDSKSSKLYQILGRIYSAGGNKIRVMEIFEFAIDRGVIEPMVVDMLSRIYLEENHIKKSVALYSYLIDMDAENPNYLKVLAELHVRQRHYEDALDTYARLFEKFPYVSPELYEPLKQLCRQAPRIPRIREVLALVCMKTCQPLEAVYHLQEMVRYNHSQLPSAISLLKKALDQYPGTFEIAFALAENLIRLDEYSEAVVYLSSIFHDMPSHTDTLIPIIESILERLPEQYSALTLGSEIYMSRKEYQKALHYFERIIALKPAELGHVEQALKTLHDVPERIEHFATLLLARLYVVTGRTDTALGLCASLRDSTEALSSTLLQANILLADKRYDECLETLNHAKSLDPYHWDVHEKLMALHHLKQRNSKSPGIAALIEGNPVAASKLFQAAVNQDEKDWESRLLLARSFMEMGRYDMATNQLDDIRALKDLLSSESMNATIYLQAISALNAGTVPQAIKYLDQIYEREMDYMNVMALAEKYKRESILDVRGRALSGCWFDMANMDKFSITAVENIENQLYFNKGEDWQTISFSHTHNNEGVQHFLKHNLTAAEEEFKLAIQLDPKLTISHVNLALLNLNKGQLEEAEEHISNAKAINPDLDLIPATQGLIKMAKGHFDLAKESLNAALKLNPKNGIALVNLGDIYFYNHSVKQALHYWRQAAEFTQLFHIIQRRTRYLDPGNFSPDYWVNQFQPHIDNIL